MTNKPAVTKKKPAKKPAKPAADKKPAKKPAKPAADKKPAKKPAKPTKKADGRARDRRVPLSALTEESLQALLFRRRKKLAEGKCYVLVERCQNSDGGGGGAGAFAVCLSEGRAASRLLAAARHFWKRQQQDDADDPLEFTPESDLFDREPCFEHGAIQFRNHLYDLWIWSVTTLPIDESR